MNNTKLLFFEFNDLYQIFDELNSFLNFKIKNINNSSELELEIKNTDEYLIITNNAKLKFTNKIVLKNLPISFNKIIELINIAILKNSFSKKSKIKIGKYKINLNSREIFFNKSSLKLTEKEIKIIVYLSESLNPVKIEELQKKIWGYSSELETHTVETHIHRLRKKISDIYKDQNFILSTKDGYKII
tara:strand:- start:1826 stop:2389 length:564 start_codon:yes stop_codon:yes gene_type:complete